MKTIIANMISKTHPDLYIKTKRIIESADNISERIIDRLHIVSISKSKEDWMQKLLFITSCLILFSPETIVGNCKVRSGVSKQIAGKLNVTTNAISYHIKNSRHYYSKMPDFKNTVHEIVKEVKDE